MQVTWRYKGCDWLEVDVTGRDWHPVTMTGDQADEVREARIARGWSKEEAARRAGVSSITWKRVEDGMRVRETSLAKILGAVAVGGPGQDEATTAAGSDDLLYKRPEGVADAEWERIKGRMDGYLDGLLDQAADER